MQPSTVIVTISVALAAAVTAGAGCGATNANSPGTPDAAEESMAPGENPEGAPPDVDAAPFAIAPFTQEMPQIIDHNPGAVLSAPRIAMASYDGDTVAATLEQLAAAIGTSTYWKAVVSEYGVGPLAYQPPVRLSAQAPASIQDSEVQGLVESTFGSLDPSTIYTIVFPAGTTVVGARGGVSCTDFGGYHSSLSRADGTPIPYAVIADCPTIPIGATAYATAMLSHELAEASTDPFAPTRPAFVGLDAHSLGWSIAKARGTEVGDMCENPTTGHEQDVQLDARLATIWSNGAAAAGHDPCRPTPPGDIYFQTVATSVPDTVTVDIQGRTVTGSAFKVAAGQSRTIELGLFSDGPTQPWTVTVSQLAQSGATPPQLSLSLDAPSGNNGDRVHLTIGAPAGSGGQAVFVLNSTLGSTQHAWYGLVVVDS